MKPITNPNLSDEFMPVEQVLLERQAQQLQNQVKNFQHAQAQDNSYTQQLNTYTQQPNTYTQQLNTYTQQPNIPDLHQDPNVEMPNAQQRSRISQTVTNTGPSKESIIEEKITEDLQKVKPAVQGLQKPLDVLKSLIAKGEYKEDVLLYQQKWTLRALDQSDMLLVLDEVDDMINSTVGRLSAIAFAQIVYALEGINGVTIYEMFQDTIKASDYSTQMAYIIAVKKALRRYLEHFPPSVIDSLYAAYVEVDKRRNEALDKLKNS